MATEQEYDDILRYKTNTTKYRPGLSDNEKRNIRDKASRYRLYIILIAIANYNIGGQVRLYDSLFSGKISNSLSKQICQVYQNAVVDESLPTVAQ